MTDRMPESIAQGLAFLNRPARRPRPTMVQLQKKPTMGEWYDLPRQHSEAQAAALMAERPGVYRIKGQRPVTAPTWVADDGGRAAAGYRGTTGDCATRATAIASGLTYQDTYDRINALARRERTGKRKRRVSNARLGVHRVVMDWLLVDQLGATWTPTMAIGSGCTVHLLAAELPATGRHVLSLSRHYAAWVDGVLHDTYDCSRDGTRCVYGYWTLPEGLAD